MTSKRMRPKAGGGIPAIFYTISKAVEVGPWRLWKKMRSRNACKTCAVGMGGQLGGMVNESRHFPEVCKKSLQAQVADMNGAIDADFFDRNSLIELMKLTPKQAEDCGRLTYPVLLEPSASHFKPITWEHGLSLLSDALKNSDPNRTAFYASGRSSNEAAFILQSFARIYGTNNVMNCSYYCHQASGVALKMAFGTGTATIALEDIDKCDLVVLAGANPASNHPRLMTKLAELKERGGHVIVINPVRERGLERFHVPSRVKSLFFGTDISSLYLQPLAGGDVALFIGILKSLIENNKIDHQFLSAHAVDSEPALSDANNLSWETIVEESGVDKLTIQRAAEMIGGADAVIFAWAMGLTHHASGVENILALSNIAIATGNVGKEACGMLPIRGHSNVQGVGSVGFAPALQEAVKTALEKLYGKQFPTAPGYDTYAMMEAAERGDLDCLMALGGNLWGSNPNSDWAAAAMQKVGTIAYLSTKLNPGHFYGRGRRTLVFPVLARDEEAQATTQESMFNFVRLSDGGELNVKGQMRAESEVICDLANRILGDNPVDWNGMRDHKQVRQLIAQAIPGWEEIATIDDTRREFTITNRIVHEPKFFTVDGKAKMHQVDLPKLPDALRLITLRSEGQFNTVVYEEQDIYRGLPHRHCILVAAEDAKRLNVADGQRVTVRGEAGKMDNIEVVLGAIRPGVVAMFYPESNVLIKGSIDPRSKTPAFKSAPVWINQ